MKRSYLILGLLLFFPRVIAQSPIPGADRAFNNSVYTFQEHWNVFIRKFNGCPMTGLSEENVKDLCKPMVGTLDYGAFLKSRNAAKKLFDLVEAKE